MLPVFWMATTTLLLLVNDNDLDHSFSRNATTRMNSRLHSSSIVINSNPASYNSKSDDDDDDDEDDNNESNKSDDKSAIVVGGGFAGLAMALGLISNDGPGFDRVHIIEKRPSFAFRAGATLGIPPNGINALKELLGGDDILSSLGKPNAYSAGRMLMWWTVRDALLKRCLEDPRICIYNGWSLHSIQDDSSSSSSSVKATFASSAKHGDDNTAKSLLELEGDLLIGADGVNSVTRGLLDKTRAKAIDTGVTVWRGTFQVDKNDSGPAARYLEKDDPPIWFVGKTVFRIFNHNSPATPGLMTWVISTKDTVPEKDSHPRTVLEKHFSKDGGTAGEEDDKDVLDKNVQKTLEAIFDLANPDDLKRPIRMNVVKPYKEEIGAEPQRWGGNGRCTLIGDAAHAMRPLRGLGSSLAFEDCVVLKRALNDLYGVATHGQHQDDGQPQSASNTLQACLKEFEEERFYRVKRIWDEEWQSAEKGYKDKFAGSPSPDLDNMDWIFQGV